MKPQLDMIGLVAADLAASLAFYRRLGLDIPAGAENEPHVDLTLPGGVRISWDTAKLISEIDPRWTPPAGGHRIALAFLCESPAAVDETYRHMVEGGYAGHQEPWDAFWGQRYATLRDPDGNGVDLFAPLS
ncbi:VOC family protein [Hamadaea tsunoensis]|uniref:VOC family protein n=1 Tax=Hamadaea tsunoensis TaxID=53368 RepID=UPI0003FF425D|nr:VOC family protein [Hamadaea tsunoensis]